jgi:hypothetical protein
MNGTKVIRYSDILLSCYTKNTLAANREVRNSLNEVEFDEDRSGYIFIRLRVIDKFYVHLHCKL